MSEGTTCETIHVSWNSKKRKIAELAFQDHATSLSFRLLPLPNIATAHPQPQPVAPPREANLKLQAALERATKARKLSIQLKGVDYAKELSDQMLKNAASMEALYMELNGILTSSPVDRKKMKPVLAQLEQKISGLRRQKRQRLGSWVTKKEAPKEC